MPLAPGNQTLDHDFVRKCFTIALMLLWWEFVESSSHHLLDPFQMTCKLHQGASFLHSHSFPSLATTTTSAIQILVAVVPTSVQTYGKRRLLLRLFQDGDARTSVPCRSQLAMHSLRKTSTDFTSGFPLITSSDHHRTNQHPTTKVLMQKSHPQKQEPKLEL